MGVHSAALGGQPTRRRSSLLLLSTTPTNKTSTFSQLHNEMYTIITEPDKRATTTNMERMLGWCEQMRFHLCGVK